MLSLQDLGRPAEVRPPAETSGVAELELFEPGEQVPPPHVEPEDSGVLQLPPTEDLELEEPPPGEAPLSTDELPVVVEEPEPEAPSLPPEEASRLKDLLLETYHGIHSKSYYEVLELPDDADNDALERAYRDKLETFSDERYEAVNLGDDDDKLIEMSLIVQQAFTVLSDPGKRTSYDETLSSAKVQPTAAPDAFGAELYFQEGQVLLKQTDLPGAESAFLRATRENPEQPDYHSFLGWTRFLRGGRGASGAAAARPHLERAFESRPIQSRRTSSPGGSSGTRATSTRRWSTSCVRSRSVRRASISSRRSRTSWSGWSATQISSTSIVG